MIPGKHECHNKSGVKFNNARLAELNEEFLQRRREYGEAEESIKVINDD